MMQNFLRYLVEGINMIYFNLKTVGDKAETTEFSSSQIQIKTQELIDYVHHAKITAVKTHAILLEYQKKGLIQLLSRFEYLRALEKNGNTAELMGFVQFYGHAYRITNQGLLFLNQSRISQQEPGSS